MFTYNFFIQQNFLTVFGDQPFALLVYDIQVNFTVFRKIQNNFRTVYTVFLPHPEPLEPLEHRGNPAQARPSLLLLRRSFTLEFILFPRWITCILIPNVTP